MLKTGQNCCQKIKKKEQTISTFCLVRRIQDKTKLLLVTQNICYFKD